ncbi:MAG TPA: tetratricopeptide repeat protein [Schlesneria sp.]
MTTRRFATTGMLFLCIQGVLFAAGSNLDDESTSKERIETVVGSAADYICRAKEAFADDDFDLAMQEIDDAIRLDATSSEAFQIRGGLWAVQGKLDAAVLDCREGLRLNPKSPQASTMLAMVLVERNEKDDLDEATGKLDEAIRLDPNYCSAFINRGNVHRLRGELEQAIKVVEQAIKLDPNAPMAYLQLATILAERRELNKAILNYNESIRLNSKSAIAFRDRGRCRFELGRHELAFEDYTRAIELDPKNAEAYFHRAEAYESRKQPTKALSDLKEAIRLDPKDKCAYELQAFILACNPDMTIRDGHLAVESARKACELSGWKDDDYLVTLALAHAEAGQFSDARKRLKEATDMAPTANAGFRSIAAELFEIDLAYRFEGRHR